MKQQGDTLSRKKFQLTTSHRGRQYTITSSGSLILIFQLTTSHRGRQFGKISVFGLLYFNSLPHTEVDEDILAELSRYTKFQLTTSHRGRLLPPNFLPPQHYFNSLPHTEVDSPFSHFYFLLKLISTHYLTQR